MRPAVASQTGDGVRGSGRDRDLYAGAPSTRSAGLVSMSVAQPSPPDPVAVPALGAPVP